LGGLVGGFWGAETGDTRIEDQNESITKPIKRFSQKHKQLEGERTKTGKRRVTRLLGDRGDVPLLWPVNRVIPNKIGKEKQDPVPKE